jgi:hypothetical protein
MRKRIAEFLGVEEKRLFEDLDQFTSNKESENGI